MTIWRWSGVLVAGLLSALPMTTARAQLGVDDPDADRGARVRPSASQDEGPSRFETTTLGQGGGHTRIRVHGPPPERYSVRKGDTLWSITGQFFGNPWEWPRVWALNPEITNPHWIYPDHSLRLRGAGEGEAELPSDSATSSSPSSRRDSHSDTSARSTPGTIRLREEGYLDREALEDAGTIVGSPEDHMLLATYDRVYIRFASKAQPSTGRTYTIFRHVSASERPPQEKGELVRILGAIRLEHYDEKRKIGEGVIVETLDPIERGHKVAEMERRFVLVQPKRNASERKGKIIATPRSQELSAQHQVVFIDLGAEHGLQVGNRVFIVRAGDQWRRERVEAGAEDKSSESDAHMEDGNFPPEVVAEGRVASVRPRNSAVIITRSLTELSVGDIVELREGF